MSYSTYNRLILFIFFSVNLRASSVRLVSVINNNSIMTNNKEANTQTHAYHAQAIMHYSYAHTDTQNGPLLYCYWDYYLVWESCKATFSWKAIESKRKLGIVNQSNFMLLHSCECRILCKSFTAPFNCNSIASCHLPIMWHTQACIPIVL